MKKGFWAALLLGFILAACPNGPTPVTDGVEYCKDAQAHLEELGCIAKDKPYTVKGKSFAQFCQETMMNGIDLSPNCIAHVTSCSQVNSCVQKKK